MAKAPAKTEGKRSYNRKEMSPEQKRQKLLNQLAKLKFELGSEGLEEAISQAADITDYKPYLNSDQLETIDGLINSVELLYKAFEFDGRISLKTALILLYTLKRDGEGSPMTNKTLSEAHPSFAKITQQFYSNLIEIGWLETQDNPFSGRSKSLKYTDRFKSGVLPMLVAKKEE